MKGCVCTYVRAWHLQITNQCRSKALKPVLLLSIAFRRVSTLEKRKSNQFHPGNLPMVLQPVHLPSPIFFSVLFTSENSFWATRKFFSLLKKNSCHPKQIFGRKQDRKNIGDGQMYRLIVSVYWEIQRKFFETEKFRTISTFSDSRF